MKLWRIYQDKNDGYDTYDSAVVVANTIEDARRTFPSTNDDGTACYIWVGDKWEDARGFEFHNYVWTTPEHVGVIELGLALDPTPRVVCASFNAG